MTSPEIKILLSLACVAAVTAFFAEIRMTHKARRLRDWVQKEYPDLWLELNVIARHLNGGHPGLNALYRRNLVHLPRFKQEYDQIRTVERHLLVGIAVGIVCIGLVVAGERWWGWQW